MTSTVDIVGPGEYETLSGWLDRTARKSAAVLGYHYPDYLETIAPAVGGELLLLCIRRSGDFAAYLPGFVKRSNFGAVYCSLPFFGPSAGVITESTSPLAKGWHRTLLSEALAYTRACNGLAFTVYTPLLNGQVEWYDRELSAARVSDREALVLDLRTSVNWDRNLMYDLRKSARAGVRIHDTWDSAIEEEFWDVYRDECSMLQLPVKPKSVIEQLLSLARSGQRCRFLYATLENHFVGGLLALQSPAVASYYLPAARREHRSLQVNSVLIDAMIRRSQLEGCILWNFEASPGRASGVYRFKAKWGSQPAVYRVYSVALKPESHLKEIGLETLASTFPYYYVYPYTALQS